MDKICYRNPSKSEVIGRCGGNEKTDWPPRTNKSWMLKKKFIHLIGVALTGDLDRRTRWSLSYCHIVYRWYK